MLGILTLAQAIAQQENVNPAYNNPGALMAAPSSYCQLGKAPNGVVQFCTIDDGWNALDNQISLDAGRGMTLQDMFNSYAPVSVPGNDPVAYARNVGSWTGLDPSTSLSTVDPSALFSPMFSVDSTGTGFDLSNLGISTAGFVSQGIDWKVILIIAMVALIGKKVLFG